MTVENEVAEGTLLATEWRAVGTHDGPLEDIPPTGNTIDIRGHAIARFDRGKVVEVFEVFDELAMLQQIAATSPWKNPGISFSIGSAMSLEVNRATGQRRTWTPANSDRRARLSQVFEGANGGR